MSRLLAVALGLLALGLAVFGLLEWMAGDDWTEEPDPTQAAGA